MRCFSFPGGAWEQASRSPTRAVASAPGLATPRLLYFHFHETGHLAKLEELLGRAGRKQMHTPGDDSGAARLGAGAEGSPVIAVLVTVCSPGSCSVHKIREAESR
ncbi:MAG: hypothetical protein HY268_08060 [Deltaproteobacteria bacterium]|nr:hypothetical protein [Deltaproteobacteria bacterium]